MDDQSPNRAHLPAVDHIRAAAALLIVLYHALHVLGSQLAYGDIAVATHWPATTNPLLAVLVEGHTAVGGFMVLSGFIFVQGTLGRNVAYGRFLANRLLRIYPLYGLLLAVGASAYHDQFSLSGLVQSVLPLANFPGAASYGVLLRLLNQRGGMALLRLVLVLAMLRTAAVLLGADAQTMAYWTIAGRMDQFLVGMIAGAWFARRPAGGAGLGLWLIPAVIALVALLAAYHRMGGWPAAAAWKLAWPDAEALAWVAVILAWTGVAPHLPGLLSAALCHVGRVSFSIYLLHFLVIEVVRTHLLFLAPPDAPYRAALLLGVLLVVPLTIAVASFTHAAVEAPFMALRRRYTD